MSIVTKHGDGGMTRLASGELVSKTDLHVEACGALDELFSFLGLARSLVRNEEVVSYIKKIQEDLFVLGTELSSSPARPPSETIGEMHLKYIEGLVGEYEPKIRSSGFAIPGDSTPSAALDVARSCCRRFERRVVKLKEMGEFDNAWALKYVNRLSDLLFIFARHE